MTVPPHDSRIGLLEIDAGKHSVNHVGDRERMLLMLVTQLTHRQHVQNERALLRAHSTGMSRSTLSALEILVC
jgi:hypothetical protein